LVPLNKMPRTRPSLPTKSLPKTMVRGKRTGRRIHATRVAPNEDGLQNMEAFFDAQTNVEETEDAKPPAAAKKKKRIRTTQTTKPRTPKASVRLSVGNDDDSDDEDEDEDDMKEYQAEALTQKYIAKLKTHITSPSELSKVSTAPPTPHEREATRFAANDDDHEDDEKSDDEVLLTQEEKPEEEELVVPQSAAETAGAKPQLLDRVESPEPAFPPMDLDNLDPQAHSDDDGFDMGPPDQDDDDDDDDGDDLPAPETEPEDKKPEASSKMESDTEDDDDKEDDKEGSNFNMVHDPETPASVRKKRADEEKIALEWKRGRTKKKRSDSDVDDNNDNDDEVSEMLTPVRKMKKKKKRNVVFSPQGVPIANRSYKAVPVADLVEESPGEDGPRRSRRAKCKPLDYWKNEKFEYGAHHETGVLGEAMGDMPIVVNVVKAMPTPYKKREVTKNSSSSKQQNGRKAVKRPAIEDNQEEPFDTKRLRNKYKVVDGEIAHIWDDTADDSADLSKYTTNMTWIDLNSLYILLTHNNFI
jgi:centromere protein C